MSPDLKPGDSPEEVHKKKFIRVGQRIYYANVSGESIFHNDLAREIGIGPARDRPVVNDGGMLFNYKGKIAFGGHTTTCEIKGNLREARQETEKIGKEILGEDKVL